MGYIGQFLAWLNDNSGILTFLTVIATFFTCWCSYKSARATMDQVAEMRRQFEEENRANIDVEFLYEKRAYYGLRFVNRGRCTAHQVEIIFEDSFIDSIKEEIFSDLLKKQRGKTCIIGIGQHYDVFIGSNEYRRNPHKVPAKGVVKYVSDGQPYETEFVVHLENYVTIFSVNSVQEDLANKIMKQTSVLKEIKGELKEINQSLSEKDSND